MLLSDRRLRWLLLLRLRLRLYVTAIQRPRVNGIGGWLGIQIENPRFLYRAQPSPADRQEINITLYRCDLSKSHLFQTLHSSEPPVDSGRPQSAIVDHRTFACRRIKLVLNRMIKCVTITRSKVVTFAPLKVDNCKTLETTLREIAQ